jgi:hypothetical protein
MSASAPSVAPQTPPVIMSQPARIVNTFIAPSKTFGDLHKSASWWMAWLLMLIVSYGFIYTIDQKIGMDQVTQNEIAKNARAAARMEQMSPEQRTKAIETSAKITRIVYYVAPVLGLLFYVLVAAVLLGTFNFGLGTAVPFKTALAITVYAFLPSAVGGLVGMIGMLGVNPEGFNARNPIASNPAYFMDPTAHKFLYGMASALDIFSLWTVVLLGIGFSCQSKTKRSTAITVVLGWFILIKLVGAAWAALS